MSSEGASAVTASTKEELEALVVKLKEENKKLSDHVYRLQSELLDVRTKENSQGRIASSNAFPPHVVVFYVITFSISPPTSAAEDLFSLCHRHCCGCADCYHASGR